MTFRFKSQADCFAFGPHDQRARAGSEGKTERLLRLVFTTGAAESAEIDAQLHEIVAGHVEEDGVRLRGGLRLNCAAGVEEHGPPRIADTAQLGMSPETAALQQSRHDAYHIFRSGTETAQEQVGGVEVE